MSFGTKPHYAIRQVGPRHFFQTAALAGIGEDLVPLIIDELPGEGVVAIDRVKEDLPSGFPGRIAKSISNGVKRRLRILVSGDQEEFSGKAI
jgi:serine/threonine-protein kinase HipA